MSGAIPTGGQTGTRHRGHRAAGSVGAALGRLVSPTRAAGALALLGALAGAGAAAASGGGTVASGPTTGDVPRAAPAPVADVGATPDGRPSSAPVVRPAAPRTAAPATPAAPTTSAPSTAPPARRTVPVDGGRTLWSADFARAGLANFRSTPWNNEGARAPRVAGGALDFAMPGGGKRSEVEPDFKELHEGDEYYFGFTVRLDQNFPVNTSDWQVITQFKNDGTGSPPLEVKVQNGKFLLDGGDGEFSQVIGDAVPGRSTHLALRVKFSSSDGSVTAWQDGVQRVANLRPPSGTMYAGKPSYVKTGIYRDTSISQPGNLSFTSWAIGTSLAAVDGAAPAAPAAAVD